MKEIKIIAPVKKPEDIETFSEATKCRAYYVYYKKFLNNNFEYVSEFVNAAKKKNCAIYINFKHDINEENLPEIKKMLKFLKTSGIDGIFINSYAMLEAIKLFNLPFKVIVDSYFALLERRPYRSAKSKEDAVKTIMGEINSKWSDKLAKEFIAIIKNDID